MENIVEKLDEMTARKIKTYPHNSNRASECGHPCERYLVAVRTHGDKIALHSVGLQRIFDEGHLHEESVLQELRDAGYKLVEQQRHLEWKNFQLTGAIDTKVELAGKRIPLEIKSCSPNSFRAVQKMVGLDFIQAKQSWLRKYPAQLLAYMLLCEESEGYMIFKNKSTGEKCQKNFQLEGEMLVYAESILQKLTRVNAHVKAGTLPEVKQIDDCKGCPFCSTLCFPGQDYGPGFSVMSDADLEAKLERREELDEARAEYEDLDKEIKAAVQGKNLVVGHFIIESKESERRSVKVPEELKKQFEVVTKYWRVTIERI